MKEKSIDGTILSGSSSAIFLKEYLTENIPEFKDDNYRRNGSSDCEDQNNSQ